MLVFYISITIENHHTENVVVSKTNPNSRNTPFCGNLSLPCLTLAYAVNDIAKENDSVLLENDISNPTTSYVETSVIQISKSITIQPLNRRANASVIVKVTRHPALFYMHCRTRCKFQIHGLVIDSPIAAVYFSGGADSAISVTDTIINSRMSLYTANGLIQSCLNLTFVNVLSRGFNFNGDLVMYAENSTFDFQNLLYFVAEPLASSDSIIVDFRNVTFRNGKLISHHNPLVNATQKVVFSFTNCSCIDARVYVRGVHTLRITDSNFVANQSKKDMYYLPFIQVYGAKNVSIERSLFVNSSYGALSFSNCQYIYLNTSTFADNKKLVREAQGGGALLSLFSHVIINACRFTNNTAVRGGGTIHHLSGFLEVMDSVIETDAASPYNSAIFCQSHGSFKDVDVRITNFVVEKVTVLTLLPFNADFQQMSTWDIKSNFYIHCAANQKMVLFEERSPYSNSTTRYTGITASCDPCEKGTYSFEEGSQHYSTRDNQHENSVTCLACAQEAICDGGSIVSKGNNWGYRRGNKVEFVPCPTYYCCSGLDKLCVSYNTCARDRRGAICGECIPGYSEGIFSTQCLPTEKCYNGAIGFWLIYTITIILFTYILMYMKDIFIFFKACVFKKRSSNTHHRTLTMEEILSEPLITERNNEESQQESGEDESEAETESTCNNISSQNFIRISNQPEQQSTIKDTGNLISGAFKILVQFYQIESMLRVSSPDKNDLAPASNILVDLVVSFFNIKIISDMNSNEDSIFSVCPVAGLTALGKEFILASPTFSCLSVVLVSYILYKLFNNINKKKHQNLTTRQSTFTDNIKGFETRLKCCIVQLFLIGYATFSLYLLKLVNCIEIGEQEQQVLYIQGNILCYTGWQYVVFFVIIAWVVPFSFALYISSEMLLTDVITPNQFLITLFAPIYSFVVNIRMRLNPKAILIAKDGKGVNMKTHTRKNMLVLLSGPFREAHKLGHPIIVWQSVLVFRRLLFCLVHVFVRHPVIKLYLMLALLVLCLVHHGFIRPFKKKLLNISETVSLAVLCLLCCINLFWSYSNTVNVNSMRHFREIGKAFLLIEISALLAPPVLCILYGIIGYCFSKFCKK